MLRSPFLLVLSLNELDVFGFGHRRFRRFSAIPGGWRQVLSSLITFFRGIIGCQRFGRPAHVLEQLCLSLSSLRAWRFVSTKTLSEAHGYKLYRQALGGFGSIPGVPRVPRKKHILGKLETNPVKFAPAVQQLHLG